jgi:hypothetical protein
MGSTSWHVKGILPHFISLWQCRVKLVYVIKPSKKITGWLRRVGRSQTDQTVLKQYSSMCESHIDSSFVSLDTSSMCETASPSPPLAGPSASSPRLWQPPCCLDVGRTPDLVSTRHLSAFESPFMATEVEGWRRICSPVLWWSFSAHGQRGTPDLLWSSLLAVLRQGISVGCWSDLSSSWSDNDGNSAKPAKPCNQPAPKRLVTSCLNSLNQPNQIKTVANCLVWENCRNRSKPGLHRVTNQAAPYHDDNCSEFNNYVHMIHS